MTATTFCTPGPDIPPTPNSFELARWRQLLYISTSQQSVFFLYQSSLAKMAYRRSIHTVHLMLYRSTLAKYFRILARYVAQHMISCTPLLLLAVDLVAPGPGQLHSLEASF